MNPNPAVERQGQQHPHAHEHRHEYDPQGPQQHGGDDARGGEDVYGSEDVYGGEGAHEGVGRRGKGKQRHSSAVAAAPGPPEPLAHPQHPQHSRPPEPSEPVARSERSEHAGPSGSSEHAGPSGSSERAAPSGPLARPDRSEFAAPSAPLAPGGPSISAPPSSASPSPHATRNRQSAWAVCLLRGVLAAGLGLGGFAVVVMVLWISSPYPDAGAGAALHIAAGLWLLAHGADLVRTETLNGGAAPVGLTPLLCTALPLWLAHRAARDALEEEAEDGDGAEVVRNVPSGWAAFGGVTLGYLAVGAAAALYAAGGPLPAVPVSAAVQLPLVVCLAAAAGVWTAFGRPHAPLPRWAPRGVRRALTHPRLTAAARAAVAGTAVLMGGGALAVGVSLAMHIDLAQESFLDLAGEWSGRFAVLLLALLLVPNAAIWAASYGIGTGFGLGTGAAATPLGSAGTAALPHFPLLAAVPQDGRGTPLNWAVAAVPLAAALTVAWFTVRVAAPAYSVREEAWGRRQTAGAVALGAVGCGVSTAVLASAAGGSLGVERLAEFGPVWWQAGLGSVVWTVVVGVPVALLLRGWRVRERSPLQVVRRGAGALGVFGFGGGTEVPSPAREFTGFPASAPAPYLPPPTAVPPPPVAAPAADVTASTPPSTPAPAPAFPVEAESAWHDSGAREVRWAALREASGGLMADLPDEEEAPRPGPTDQ
ncbi:DUF6350 family protein [Streptomyces sp. NPDC051561]|uniref:cell division protein PerM n=1 Tax=Streptomyces sp. NPDC051561 TaxID=3365658 RepID=UPI00379D5A2A